MKPRTLVVLVTILAVLGGLIAMRRSQQVETSIVDQVKLSSLVPAGVTAADITKVIVYTGERAEKKVELAKIEDKWRAVSYYNAPVAEAKIEPYIQSVIDVKGEFRANAPEAGLADYGLSEDKAFHIEGYAGDAQRFHVLVGKAPKTGSAFMRAAGSSEVHITNAALKDGAGLFGDTEGMAASPDWWLDKSVLSMNTDEVNAIDLTYPDKRIRFEKREKPAEVEAPAAEETTAEGENGETSEGEEPKAPEYEWVVAEGGLEQTLKTAAVDQLLRKLGGLSATTIVNPEKKDEYSLNPPNYVAKVTLADGTEKIINGGRPEPLKGTYLTIQDDTDGMVYAVSRFDFEDIFPLGSDLYDFKSPEVKTDEVTRITLDMPDFDAVAVKDGENWTLESPQLTLKADPYKPQDIVANVAGLTIKDFAQPGDHYGLNESLATVTLTRADGSTLTLGRGIAANSVDGYYLSVPDYDFPVIAANTQLDNVFVDLPDLFDRTIFSGLDDESIVKIEIARESGTLLLEDQQTLWKATAGEESFNADFDTIDDYRFGLTVLEAESFELAKDRQAPEPESTVTLTTSEGAVHTLKVESMLDGIYTVTASNHPDLVFKVSSEDLARVLRDAEFFKPQAAEEGVTAGETAPLTLEPVESADPHQH